MRSICDLYVDSLYSVFVSYIILYAFVCQNLEIRKICLPGVARSFISCSKIWIAPDRSFVGMHAQIYIVSGAVNF